MLLTGLHAIAADRGDGLLPEVAAFFREREARGRANLTEIATHQAGPNPSATPLEVLPEGVLAFRRKATTSNEAPKHDTMRRAANDER